MPTHFRTHFKEFGGRKMRLEPKHGRSNSSRLKFGVLSAVTVFQGSEVVPRVSVAGGVIGLILVRLGSLTGFPWAIIGVDLHLGVV